MIKSDKAFIKAVGEIQNPKLDGTNPHFRSKYATLEAVLRTIKPVLLKHGLVVVQMPTMAENGVTVETCIVSESDVIISSSMTMKPKDNSPHAVGSCITYIRRYALMSIFGIVGEEDDDGNNAQGLRPQTRSQINTPVNQPKPEMTASEHIVHAALANGWTKTDIIRAVSAKFKKGSLESLNAEEQRDLYQTVSTMTIEEVIAKKARS